MAENNRLARELENRDSAKRQQTWMPPQLLPTPDPEDGWVFRWIRTSMVGQADPTNASAKFREGWEPVKAADYPKLMHFADQSVNSRFKDNIEIGGLLLCKAPADIMKQRDAYYTRQAQSQMDAVDNSFMRTEDKRMPLFNEKRSTTSFGRGTKS
jgi:hypothetical protein